MPRGLRTFGSHWVSPGCLCYESRPCAKYASGGDHNGDVDSLRHVFITILYKLLHMYSYRHVRPIEGVFYSSVTAGLAGSTYFHILGFDPVVV